MFKENIIKWVCCLFLMLCISGCSSAPVSKTTEEADTAPENNTDQIRDEYTIYTAQVHEISPEVLSTLFLQGKEIESQYERDSQFYNGKKTVGYTCTDGTRVSAECGVFKFTTDAAENYPVQYFLDEDTAARVFAEGVTAEFPDKELWFMSRQESCDLVKSYLDKMGVEYAEDWIVYSVPGEGLTKMLKRYYPDDQYEADIAFGYKPVKRDFGQEDDVYMIAIPLAVEGNRLSQEGIYGDNQTYSLPAGWANAMVGETGLWYLEIWHPFDATGVKEAAEILNETEALAKAEEYCSHIVGLKDTHLESNGLYYAPIIKRVMTADAFELRPTWIIQVQREGKLLTKIFVDAVTGEALSLN